MKKSINNQAPKDSHSGDAMGGSYAREKSSGVFNAREGGLRRKLILIYLLRERKQGKVKSLKTGPILTVIYGMGEIERYCIMACIAKRRGRWVIDCYDQHGNRYRKALKEGTTKGEARKVLRDIEEKIARRAFLHEKKTPTFAEVAKEWLEHKKPNVRITTWEMYEVHVKKHFPDLNQLKINQITISTIEKWIATRQAKKMVLGQLRKVLVTLNQIMAYATRHRLIDSNPVRDAERPRKTIDDDRTGNINVLNPEQIRALLETTTDQKYRTLFLVAVMTGARQGEILGLKWGDVDFDGKWLHIRRTYNHCRFFSPKTKGSIRTIDLSPSVIRELAKWKLASLPNELDLVFANDVGKPIEAGDLIVHHFKPTLKAAKLPNIRFHDLRHTHASMLFEQGESITYIQHRLGHSNPSVTLSVYAHWIKTENQEAVCKLENTIFETTGHNLVTNEEKGLTING
jgi:integrase